MKNKPLNILNGATRLTQKELERDFMKLIHGHTEIKETAKAEIGSIEEYLC